MSALRNRLEAAIKAHNERYQLAESQGPIVDTILAVVEAGADGTPRPDNAQPNPGQLLAWILDADAEKRLTIMQKILDNGDAAVRCFEMGHEADRNRMPALYQQLRDLETERAKLAARLAEISRIVLEYADARRTTTDGPGS